VLSDNFLWLMIYYEIRIILRISRRKCLLEVSNGQGSLERGAGLPRVRGHSFWILGVFLLRS
jgi:hypothetical protein